MNVWLFLLLMGGLLIVLILALFWHPQRSRTRASPPADRQPTSAIFRDDEETIPFWGLTLVVFISSIIRLSVVRAA
jgi:Flp pilus assembly protein protease CpaA